MNTEFYSKDRKFGLLLPEDLVSNLMNNATHSYPNETGGILIGRYSNNLTIAEVSHISTGSIDSKKYPTQFYRGTAGLQKLLSDAWEKDRSYYLGEWHTHPNGFPIPSDPDKRQMTEISKSKKYVCPEPVLLILGEIPIKWTFGAFVFPNGKMIQMK
ncbi:Mov34/MPN/PAD-1 family protein [Cohnella yongneupensis]|uniref:Mov34/MPN/PAD-1 family protein n=1 Tax=Cohnella yongneupensis TaxID=425006 RepID=A0ABW0QTS4_9BACL